MPKLVIEKSSIPVAIGVWMNTIPGDVFETEDGSIFLRAPTVIVCLGFVRDDWVRRGKWGQYGQIDLFEPNTPTTRESAVCKNMRVVKNHGPIKVETFSR